MKKIIILIALLLIASCSTVSLTSFQELKIGMTKDEVLEILGPMSRPSDISESITGNGEIYHVYGQSGYIWYDKNDKLKGFATYADPYTEDEDSPQSISIDQANGYVFSEIQRRNVFLIFQNYENSKSSDAQLVFLENKKNIEFFFESLGYTLTNEPKKASAIIVIRLGITDERVITEMSSTPVYNFNYTPPQHSTTNVYSNTGMYIGSARTTTNPYGTYNTQYAGQHIQTQSHKVYTRSLEFTCIKNNTTDDKREIVWSSSATSTGSSGNLREIFPFIFYAISGVVEQSVSLKDYSLAWFHTGVRELVGKPIPRIERVPAQDNK